MPGPLTWLNQHPDGIEQQMTWLMNRACTDPPREGVWLVAESIQSHTDQLDRVENTGFAYLSYRGNVFSYTRSGLHRHAGFNIDWGGGDVGMQFGRGHRQTIMSMDGDYTHVGLSVVAETDPDTDVGPFVTTGNYCSADATQANHFNRFLVGTVWRDLNDNDQYDPGEGMGGISVRPDRGAYHAVTADSGGYAMPILDAGTYTVSFSGSGISGETIRTVAVDSQSMLLDLVSINGDPGDAEAITVSASAISANTAQLNGTVNANGKDVDYYFEYGPTTQYGDISEVYSTTANQRIAIAVSALSPVTLFHFRLVVVTDTDTINGNDRSFETVTADGSDPQPPPSSSGGGSGGGCFIGSVFR